ncbi:MAG TPA: hypothetical protein VKT73_12840 [Xanthobacteraceae bacterium]|nr:hypothetical protein [Xanthobacteraceae bacterium]
MVAPADPNRRRDWPEEYRIAAKKWVDAEAAASLLENTRSATEAQLIASVQEQNPKMAFNKAQQTVKASPEWAQFNQRMVEARKAANLLKVQLRYIEMKDRQLGSMEASRRAEMRLDI